MNQPNPIESRPEGKVAIRINLVQSRCNRFSNNAVSFSLNSVLSDASFSINLVPKPRMLSVRAVYVLSSLHLVHRLAYSSDVTIYMRDGTLKLQRHPFNTTLIGGRGRRIPEAGADCPMTAPMKMDNRTTRVFQGMACSNAFRWVPTTAGRVWRPRLTLARSPSPACRRDSRSPRFERGDS